LEMNSFCTKDVTLADLSGELNNLTGRDLTFAGIVAETQEGITKNGKPFSSLTLSDYNGSYKFMFFGNDFVNFGNYCKKGLFLLIRGRVAQKWQNSDQLEFKANKIELLQELAEKAESVRIMLSAELISDQLVNELDQKLAKSQGKTLLKFIVFDQTANIRLNLFSRTRRIGLTPDLKTYLQNNPDIVFTIN
jgi:DNA polymerase III subunit alpha